MQNVHCKWCVGVSGFIFRVSLIAAESTFPVLLFRLKLYSKSGPKGTPTFSACGTTDFGKSFWDVLCESLR